MLTLCCYAFAGSPASFSMGQWCQIFHSPAQVHVRDKRRIQTLPANDIARYKSHCQENQAKSCFNLSLPLIIHW